MQSECEPICKNHYLPLTHFCFYSCERVCSQCVTDNACCAAHPRSVLPEQHLTRNLLLYLEKLPQAVDSAFQRHAELGALASEARKQIKNSQDALLQIAINVMQAQNADLKSRRLLIRQLRSKLVHSGNIIDYFLALRCNDLIDAKLNLSSPLGLKVFKAREQQLSGLTRKCAEQDHRRLYEQLKHEQAELSRQQETGLGQKLKEIIQLWSKSRTMQRKSRVSESEKENCLCPQIPPRD